MVRLTRKFGALIGAVMVPTDCPVRKPGDTIYVLERFF